MNKELLIFLDNFTLYLKFFELLTQLDSFTLY